MTEIVEALSEWIKAEVERAGMKGAVLGLSGGLDSAVVGSLCVRALGEAALGVIMPCESDPEDVEHARLAAEATGLRTELVPLDAALAALEGALSESTPNARANLKPRLRMTVLYHYANRLSYLVAGTGNRSEIMAGYFTKFGDGAADFLPLGGLYKTEVRELARELGVPKEITTKPPSAGLRKGQTDEGELGMSYEELDRALAAIDSGRSDAASSLPLERVRRMVEALRAKVEA